MKKILLATVLSVLAVPAFAQGASTFMQMKMPCQPSQYWATQESIIGFGEHKKFTGAGIDDRLGSDLDLFWNPSTATWTIFITFQDGTTCKVASGINAFVMN